MTWVVKIGFGSPVHFIITVDTEKANLREALSEFSYIMSRLMFSEEPSKIILEREEECANMKEKGEKNE